MIALLLITFFVLLALGVPIAMSLGLASMAGILFLDGGDVYKRQHRNLKAGQHDLQCK